MSSQHATHSIKRPAQNASLTSNPQSLRQRAQSPSPSPVGPSVSDDWSEDESFVGDPDETRYHTQAIVLSPVLEQSTSAQTSPAAHTSPAAQSLPSGHASPAAHTSPAAQSLPSGHASPSAHASPAAQSSPAAQASASVHASSSKQPLPSAHAWPSTPPLTSNPTVLEAWWTALQREQLVAYTQQQRELFTQIGQVNEALLVCTSAQEHEQLIIVMLNLSRREQELRYMLEARQAWDSFVLAHEQRQSYLSSRAQFHPYSTRDHS